MRKSVLAGILLAAAVLIADASLVLFMANVGGAGRKSLWQH